MQEGYSVNGTLSSRGRSLTPTTRSSSPAPAIGRVKISSTTHIQLLQWLHGKRQQHKEKYQIPCLGGK